MQFLVHIFSSVRVWFSPKQRTFWYVLLHLCSPYYPTANHPLSVYARPGQIPPFPGPGCQSPVLADSDFELRAQGSRCGGALGDRAARKSCFAE
jgi:hypothetical protein